MSDDSMVVAAAAPLPQQLTLNEAVQTLEQLGTALASQTASTLQIDASGLEVCDSSAVAVLLELRRRLLAQGKTLQVTHIPQRLRDLVGLYGMSELLPG
ncbi:MAG: STAS domain-containing protein [Hydrogenophaga sp.]|uniref:STAS domain-containing protein n=1 Tax=Hydrogenophaga sp. TaxID=1904254 RepID=UPI0025C242A7|nr:STAS domain-containing protein [Hydrogenophaga sp.]MCG2654021.1 STAS domain-containing protein [Hydrogenophaga sp.]